MASPLAEHNGQPPSSSSMAAVGDAHRSLPTPFLTKIYQLVDDPAIDIISWNNDGSTFIIWRSAEFAYDLLPKYFKHINFSSFVRQLNTAGFLNIVRYQWEFGSKSFCCSEKRLLYSCVGAVPRGDEVFSPFLGLLITHRKESNGIPSVREKVLQHFVFV